MVDISVRVSHLVDRNEILTALGPMANTTHDTKKLKVTLAKQLKDRHPIHKKLKTLSNSLLNKLLANLTLPVPSHRPRKMKAISDYFFREYPDAPLTNLNKIMEEDAYFAELTSGIIFKFLIKSYDCI